MNDVAKKYNAYAYAPSGKLTVVAAIDHLGSVVEQGLTPRDGHGRPYATTDNISGCIFVEFGRGYRKHDETTLCTCPLFFRGAVDMA